MSYEDLADEYECNFEYNGSPRVRPKLILVTAMSPSRMRLGWDPVEVSGSNPPDDDE